MRDFHNNWYQPQSMTAAVVGNLPVTQLIEIVARSYEQHEQDQEPRQPKLNNLPEVNPEPPFTDIVRHEYTDETLQQARLMMLSFMETN